MSNYYGTSAVAEIVVIALSVPTVIFAFLFSSLNTSFIPSYNKIRKEKGDVIADNFTSNLANVVMFVGVVICILGVIFARPLVFVMASGFTGEKFEIAVRFVRIVLLGSSTTVVAAIFSGYLNVHGSYIIPSARLVVQNIILIVFTLISVKMSYYMIAIGILVATVGQNLILIPNLRKIGYVYKFKMNFKDENIRYILVLAVPLMLGVAVDQINVFVDKTLASRALEGGVAMLNYADRINALVYIVISSIITVSYPIISNCAINNDIKSLKKTIFKYAQVNYLLCIPIVLAFIVFAQPIVKIIYERGVFTSKDTLKVSQCLIFYSITILGSSLREIVSRAFYSLDDSRTPVKNGVFMVIINAILSITLVRVIGLSGIALGTSLASMIGTITLTYKLRSKIGRFNARKFIIDLFKISIISLVVICIAKFMYDILIMHINVVLSLFTVAFIGALIYFVIIIILNLSDTRTILNNLVNKVRTNIK